MNVRALESRIARLEQYRTPRAPYVLYVSRPPQAQELAAIVAARAAGRRFAILPRKITLQEWIEQNTPRGTLQ